MKRLLLSIGLLAAGLLPTSAAAADDPLNAALSTVEPAAIDHLIESNVLISLEDGTYAVPIYATRATFVQAVVEYVYPHARKWQCLEWLDSNPRPGVDYDLLFADVSKDAPYAKELCTALVSGIVWGYPDGSFRPDATINFAEAAKVVNHAFGMEYEMPDYPYQSWYKSYIDGLEADNLVPSTIRTPEQQVTMEEAITLLSNIQRRRAERLSQLQQTPEVHRAYLYR